MDCGRIDELLPAFVEGVLGDEESTLLRQHIASCVRCRESMTSYEALERSLAGLKDAIPPWQRVSAGVFEELGLGRRRVTWMSRWRFPALVSAASLVLALVLALNREAVAYGLNLIEMGITSMAETLYHSIPVWITSIAGGQEWVAPAVYSLVCAVAILSSSMVTLHFSRR